MSDPIPPDQTRGLYIRGRDNPEAERQVKQIARLLFSHGASENPQDGAAMVLRGIAGLVHIVHTAVPPSPYRQVAVRQLENVALLCAVSGFRSYAQLREMGATETTLEDALSDAGSEEPDDDDALDGDHDEPYPPQP